MQNLLDNPTVQLVLMSVVTLAVKALWDFGSIWLRHRGKTDVERAQMALDAARLSPDAQDDVVQALALERAKSKQELFDSLAEALERNGPPKVALAPQSAAAVLGPPSKGPVPDAPKPGVPNA